MTEMRATPREKIAPIVASLRDTARSRATHSRRFRVEGLKALRRMLDEQSHRIALALREDLGKSETEALATEIGVVKSEVDHTLLHLTDWMEPTPVKVPLAFQPASAQVAPRPLGTVLIIAPWNYPFQLAINPLVGAIAAGNTVVVKPSEKAPATSKVIAELVEEYVDPRAVRVVEGGAEAVTELLEQRFDHIFYTGGERVGRIVYEAAAKQLTPVTLELGGKSPCVVSDGRNWQTIARRIVFGKFTNAGQTCVAPDYVLAVGARSERELEKRVPEVISEFYGTNPEASKDYARLVDVAQAERLEALLQGALSGPNPARLVSGGRVDAASRYMEPTVLADVDPDSELMQEEIFGPILPIIRVDTFDEAIAFITERPHPLAAYLFTDRHRYHKAFQEQVTAGGLGFDVALLHAGLHTLPFGGVGPSGMGSYHGEASFRTFSQMRPSLTKSDQVDTLRMAYPPYTWPKRQAIKRLM
ncbi:aldehyde dehydrogenase family protein [Citricoccus muralis]|uniref:Aldehyde dehydrogenase n=1 Tax=Citricoccus muralis TaxID=169134 RepID=A0ABY8H6H1_9MICC|nr:aldehyde dehydrogenase family protein [Citricoccus muralis]WFP16734.1 aldehyde dehydrogenase family protein [Citricoccus muralis]